MRPGGLLEAVSKRGVIARRAGVLPRYASFPARPRRRPPARRRSAVRPLLPPPSAAPPRSASPPGRRAARVRRRPPPSRARRRPPCTRRASPRSARPARRRAPVAAVALLAAGISPTVHSPTAHAAVNVAEPVTEPHNQACTGVQAFTSYPSPYVAVPARLCGPAESVLRSAVGLLISDKPVKAHLPEPVVVALERQGALARERHEVERAFADAVGAVSRGVVTTVATSTVIAVENFGESAAIRAEGDMESGRRAIDAVKKVGDLLSGIFDYPPAAPASISLIHQGTPAVMAGVPVSVFR